MEEFKGKVPSAHAAFAFDLGEEKPHHLRIHVEDEECEERESPAHIQVPPAYQGEDEEEEGEKSTHRQRFHGEGEEGEEDEPHHHALPAF